MAAWTSITRCPKAVVILCDGGSVSQRSGLRFLARRSFLLHDVDARYAAIPFHSEASRITG
jgi:hypothetical protein